MVRITRPNVLHAILGLPRNNSTGNLQCGKKADVKHSAQMGQV